MFESHRQLEPIAGDAIAASGKAAPPVAVAGLSLAGVSLQDWVFALTIVYLVVQTAYVVWKWVRERRNGR